MRLPKSVSNVLLTITSLGTVALWSWPGQSAADAPAGRYTISGDAVTDTETQLVWQRTASTARYTWTAAQGYCNSSGWRLPNIRELATLVDVKRHTPSIDPYAFPNTPSDHFWSASPFADGSSSFAWVVDFDGGSTNNYDVYSSYSVRCVR